MEQAILAPQPFNMASVHMNRMPSLLPGAEPLDNRRKQLAREMRSRPITIPNLKHFMGDWATAVSPHYEELKVAMDQRITELYPAKKAAALIKHDYSLLTSMWWPRADAKRLKMCAFWFLWLFTWDDEIDQSTSELFININEANLFREESFHFLRHSLGVPTDETLKWDFDNNPPKRPIIRCLDIVCADLRSVYNHDQIMCFIQEVDYYMNRQELEQHRKLTGVMPTVAHYWETRLGTSAVTSMLALNEYADGQSIPRWIMTHDRMLDLWREVNVNMCLSNDMLSLRKEIKHGDIDSSIPVLVNSGLTIDNAIAKACEELGASVRRFDEAAADLVLVAEQCGSRMVADIKSYITGCEHNQTANLLWSLESARYGLGDIQRNPDGGLTISIGAPNSISQG